MNDSIKFHIKKFHIRGYEIKELMIALALAAILGLSLWFYLPEDMSSENDDISLENSAVQTVYRDNNFAEMGGDTTIGLAIVTDGDTLEINRKSIRLYGIDSPEISQPCWREDMKYQCGRDAKAYLERLINKNEVICKIIDSDRYGRDIAKCFNYENINLNAMMVVSGNAVAYLYFSREYANFQSEAKKHKRGIWAGRFTEPYQYRKNNRSY